MHYPIHHCRRQISRFHQQRGVALITVLLVFAVVAVIAAEMLRRSQLNVRSVANLMDTRQAYYYTLGGEALARQLLALDVRDGHGNKDALNEAWAQTAEQAPFVIDKGAIKVEIHDLQGRFNLNSLVDANGLPMEVALGRFRQLLAGLGLNIHYADEWRDWVDRDQAAQSNGAEDAAYPHYKTAGGPEADISALRLLKDMQPDDYDKLAPHVTVLPADALININTADSAVLRAYSPIMGTQIDRIKARQQQGGYADVAELQQAVGSGLDDVAGLAVNSSYYEVITTVKYLDRLQRLRSVLKRNPTSGAITVLSRSRTPFVEPNGSENSENPKL